MDLRDFYLGASTAAATLVGLLFVAIQFNLQTIREDRTGRWHATARSTFLVYVVLFLVPLVNVIPGNVNHLIGTVILISLSTRGILRAWLGARRAFQGRRITRLIQTAWLLVAPLLAYAFLLFYAIQRVAGNRDADFGTAFTLIALFGIALRNTWDLLVEIRAQEEE